jgi:hypothetical protein
MTDCGHLALIASGEARGLCPLCQKAEIERLTKETVVADQHIKVAWAERDQYLEQNVKLKAEVERLHLVMRTRRHRRGGRRRRA